jgi:hypothetical protein
VSRLILRTEFWMTRRLVTTPEMWISTSIAGNIYHGPAVQCTCYEPSWLICGRLYGFAPSHLNCHDDRTSLAKNEESRARTACSSLRVPAMSLIYGIRPEFSASTYMTSNHYKIVKLRLFDIILFSPCRHASTLPT